MFCRPVPKNPNVPIRTFSHRLYGRYFAEHTTGQQMHRLLGDPSAFDSSASNTLLATVPAARDERSRATDDCGTYGLTCLCRGCGVHTDQLNRVYRRRG